MAIYILLFIYIYIYVLYMYIYKGFGVVHMGPINELVRQLGCELRSCIAKG